MTYVYENMTTEIPRHVTKVTIRGKDYFLDFDLANGVKRFIVEGKEDDALTLIKWFTTSKKD